MVHLLFLPPIVAKKSSCENWRGALDMASKKVFLAKTNILMLWKKLTKTC